MVASRRSSRETPVACKRKQVRRARSTGVPDCTTSREGTAGYIMFSARGRTSRVSQGGGQLTRSHPCARMHPEAPRGCGPRLSTLFPAAIVKDNLTGKKRKGKPHIHTQHSTHASITNASSATWPRRGTGKTQTLCEIALHKAIGFADRQSSALPSRMSKRTEKKKTNASRTCGPPFCSSTQG